MILLLLSKVMLSCLVIIMVMMASAAVYRDSAEKEPADWFKVIGGIVIVVGFVSSVSAVFIAIWTIPN